MREGEGELGVMEWEKVVVWRFCAWKFIVFLLCFLLVWLNRGFCDLWRSRDREGRLMGRLERCDRVKGGFRGFTWEGQGCRKEKSGVCLILLCVLRIWSSF